MAAEADVLLSDGTTVHLRPIRPEDADAVVLMHSRFSERTRYLRYFSPYPRIPPRDLRRFVNVDHRDREALVVVAGSDLVAVGRYDRLGQDAADAEVAFVVEDAYQGRGVGSVLLEHLAAAAREVGVERFVAEVLPANATMLNVFTDAGYEVSRRYADGVVHLTFPVAQTDRSLAVQWEREHRTEARSVARLLRPEGIAVYGASRSGRGVGAALLTHIQSMPTHPTVYLARPPAAAEAPPVPPTAAPPAPPAAAQAIPDRPAAAQAIPVPPAAAQAIPVPPAAAQAISDRPAAAQAIPGRSADGWAGGKVDLAVVAVPPESVLDVLADAARAGAHGLLVVSELDPVRREEMVRAARSAGMRLIGPASLGVADHAAGLNATLLPRLPKPGRVALFCQSGPLGLQLLAEADRRGVGISGFVSVGRRADVSGNDLLQFWADDPETDVIAMYLETFGNPRKFSRIARIIGRRKPIIILAGETGLVGSGLDSTAMEALRARSGVIEVGTVAELFDVARLLDRQPLAAGDRVGIVGNASALTALAAARARNAGLTVGRVASLGPAATPEELAGALKSTVDSDDADALVVVVAPPLPTGPMSAEAPVFAPFAAAIGAVSQVADKPVAAMFLAGDGPAGTPTYHSIEETVRALSHVMRRAAWLREPSGRLPPPRPVPVAANIPDLLDAYEVPVQASKTATTADLAVAAADELGYPVALKAVDHPHRIDLGAVRLNLPDAMLVRRAYDQMRVLFGETVVVQSMAPPGVPCVIEALDDPAFGPVVGFGLGGPITELVGDRAWRAAPLTDRDAASLVHAPKAAPLLAGMDLTSLAELLVRIGQMADQVPQLRRLVLNPVLVHRHGWTVLHADGTLEPPAPRPDTGPRHL